MRKETRKERTPSFWGIKATCGHMSWAIPEWGGAWCRHEGLEKAVTQLGKTTPGCRLGPKGSKRTGSNPPLTGLHGSLSCRRPHSPVQSEGFNEVMLAAWPVQGYSCSRNVCRMDGYTDVCSPAPAVSRPPMRTVTIEVPVSMGR